MPREKYQEKNDEWKLLLSSLILTLSFRFGSLNTLVVVGIVDDSAGLFDDSNITGYNLTLIFKKIIINYSEINIYLKWTKTQ